MHPNDVAEFGYFQPRVLPTGELAALNKFMFTFGLLTGIDQVGYRCRWCYESLQAAHIALRDWDGRGDPPGPWIKQKGKNEAGEVVDRCHPDTPTWEDLRGAAPDATGDLSSEAFVRKMRNEEWNRDELPTGSPHEP